MDYLGKVSDVSGCFDRDGLSSRRSASTMNRGYSKSHGRLEFEEVLHLAKTIEGDLIPRLMLQHRSEAIKLESMPNGSDVSLRNDIEKFARLVMTHDVEVAMAQVAAIFAAGVSLETILLDLLTPTARRLGQMWDDDDCNFFEVTVGLFRLHQLLRELSRTFDVQPEHDDRDLSILLAPAPQEQHTFGILMVEEFFRRAGFDVVAKAEANIAEISAAVAASRFSAIGFSLSNELFEPDLTALIKAIRHHSLNPDILVLVGGNWFNENPDRVKRVGADASAVDGRQAIVQTRPLLRIKTGQT